MFRTPVRLLSKWEDSLPHREMSVGRISFMKIMPVVTAFALVLNPCLAFATPTCSGTAVSGTGTLAGALNNNTVCVGAAGNWQSQELHHGGSIDEYKKGPGHPTDPSVPNYGSYTIGTSASHDTIVYTYSGTTFQTYMVSINGTSISYCDNLANSGNGAGIVKVTGTLKSGGGGCP
jgi:hypothetical protein